MKRSANPAQGSHQASRLSQQLRQVEIFHGNGENAPAERLLERLTREHPGHPEILRFYGGFLRETGRSQDAARILERLVRVAPGVAANWTDLGVCRQDSGNFQEALQAYRRAIEIDPAFWQPYFNIGYLLESQNECERAEDFYRRAIHLNASHAPLWCDLGRLYLLMNRPGDAVVCFTEAVSLTPSAVNCCNLAQGQLWCGAFDDALQNARKAKEMDPRHAMAYAQEGHVLLYLGNTVEAKTSFEKAIALDAKCDSATIGMANAHSALCNWDEAVYWYVRALETNAGPNQANVHAELLFTLTQVSALPPERLFEEHRQWAQIHTAGLARFEHKPPLEEGPRKLRIGFVSADFRIHSVRSFIAPILRGLDREQFEVVCYSSFNGGDEATVALRSMAEEWHDVAQISGNALAHLIHDGRIDILVDLSGHTYGNRLRAFAQKPAPIQVTYLGYANTTGLEEMDYWLTDWCLHPENTEQRSTERIWRLPRCWVVFEPPAGCPEIANREPDAPVTFVSFNGMRKTGAESLRLWARVLAAVPDSQLLIKTKGLTGEPERAVFLARLQSAGIPSGRVTVMGDVPTQREHLELYGRGDIMLDSTPFSGGTTTAEALWMGLPVVTLPGALHASRMSASMLHAVGLDEWIAPDEDEFVRIAAGLASDTVRRREIRQTLRDRLARSPLCDGAGLANAMGAAFHEMYAAWRTQGTEAAC